MNFYEIVETNAVYIIFGLAALTIILLINIIVLGLKFRKMNKVYNKFMTGASGENLESQVLSRFEDIDNLKIEVNKLNVELSKVKDNLLLTYQKIGVVKYDAFKEMGGKLSFVMALLDKNNNGILLNSVHSSREGCYTYLKEIIKGESFLELSEDEKKALNQALNTTKYKE